MGALARGQQALVALDDDGVFESDVEHDGSRSLWRTGGKTRRQYGFDGIMSQAVSSSSLALPPLATRETPRLSGRDG